MESTKWKVTSHRSLTFRMDRVTAATRWHRCIIGVERMRVEYGPKVLGPEFNSHPVAKELGTVWGFGDFSGEIQTH